MEATVDQAGRIMLPKRARELLGLTPGSTVDVSIYGDGLHVSPAGRSAHLERRGPKLVAVAETVVTDDDVFGLLDAVRR